MNLVSDEDLETIFNEYYQEYRDRAVVNYVYDNVEDLGRSRAEDFGVVEEHYEQYFDFEEFGSDLLNDEEYIKLSDGRVASVSY
jgi:hypothetical protein